MKSKWRDRGQGRHFVQFTNAKIYHLSFRKRQNFYFFPLKLFVIYLFSTRYTTDWVNTDLLSVLELIFHSGDIRAQAQDLRLDPGVLPLELGDFSLQCVEILALDTGGPATARVTLTRAYRTPVSRTTGFQPWRQDRHGPVWSTARYTAEREIYIAYFPIPEGRGFTPQLSVHGAIRTPFRLNAKKTQPPNIGDK